jgi:hypothetical protein
MSGKGMVIELPISRLISFDAERRTFAHFNDSIKNFFFFFCSL